MADAAERALFGDDLAGRLKARAGKLYQPSNGTEGEMFCALWCGGCARDDGEGNGCEIALKTYWMDPAEAGYPAEWQYGPDGQPRCTAFLEPGAEPPRAPLPGQLSLFAGGP